MLHPRLTLPVLLAIAAVLLATARIASADALDDLSREFWEWRVVQQPVTGDDIPRVERPAGWLPDWFQGSVLRCWLSSRR